MSLEALPTHIWSFLLSTLAEPFRMTDLLKAHFAAWRQRLRWAWTVKAEPDHPRSLAYWSRVSFNQTEPLPILIPCSIA